MKTTSAITALIGPLRRFQLYAHILAWVLYKSRVQRQSGRVSSLWFPMHLRPPARRGAGDLTNLIQGDIFINTLSRLTAI